MGIYNIFRSCRACDGDGEHPDTVKDDYGNVTGGIKECDVCDGNGEYIVGTINLSDLEDKVDDVMDKCNDIKEVVDEL